MESNPAEKARQIAEAALDRLSAELEAGRSEALKNYLAVMGRFHRYSWGNTLLISSQRPDATHVAGFHAWHELGRSVRKGEKGIMILAPMIIKEKEPRRERETSAEPSRIAGFRTAYVFDVKQTEGQDLPVFAKTTGTRKIMATGSERSRLLAAFPWNTTAPLLRLKALPVAVESV